MARKGELISTSEIVRATGKNQANLSRELDKLVKYGIARQEKRGRQNFYGAVKNYKFYKELAALTASKQDLGDKYVLINEEGGAALLSLNWLARGYSSTAGMSLGVLSRPLHIFSHYKNNYVWFYCEKETLRQGEKAGLKRLLADPAVVRKEIYPPTKARGEEAFAIFYDLLKRDFIASKEEVEKLWEKFSEIINTQVALNSLAVLDMKNLVYSGYLKKYLQKNISSLSLTKKTLPQVKNKNKIEVVSIKSQSAIDKEVLKQLPNLKLIVTRTVGLDHIDLEACKARAVAVKNIVDYGSYNIAEHALALLLAGARNIVSGFSEVKKGIFSYKNHLGVCLKGKTLGVVGTGKIGLELIKRIKAFEVDVVAYDVFLNKKAEKEMGFKYVSLNQLLASSDFISLHVPLFPTTHHLIGEKEIKFMKNRVILVNTSRGEIIDTKGLIKNIKKFKAVCLDVVEGEKNFSKKHPLLKFNNVIITPHAASYSDDSIKNISAETEKIIKSFLK